VISCLTVNQTVELTREKSVPQINEIDRDHVIAVISSARKIKNESESFRKTPSREDDVAFSSMHIDALLRVVIQDC